MRRARAPCGSADMLQPRGLQPQVTLAAVEALNPELEAAQTGHPWPTLEGVEALELAAALMVQPQMELAELEAPDPGADLFLVRSSSPASSLIRSRRWWESAQWPLEFRRDFSP